MVSFDSMPKYSIYCFGNLTIPSIVESMARLSIERSKLLTSTFTRLNADGDWLGDDFRLLRPVVFFALGFGRLFFIVCSFLGLVSSFILRGTPQ
jgi:hypothetical protein